MASQTAIREHRLIALKNRNAVRAINDLGELITEDLIRIEWLMAEYTYHLNNGASEFVFLQIRDDVDAAHSRIAANRVAIRRFLAS